MTRDEIIDLAHQLDVLDTQHYGTLWVDKLARFADVVERAARKDERDVCAKACEGWIMCAIRNNDWSGGMSYALMKSIEYIRARGEK